MLGSALALYRGPLLERPLYGWAAHLARHCHEQYLNLLHRLLLLARTSQDVKEMHYLAQRWVEAAPSDVEAHLTLLQALVDCGWCDEAGRQLHSSHTWFQSQGDHKASATLEQRVGELFEVTHRSGDHKVLLRSRTV